VDSCVFFLWCPLFLAHVVKNNYTWSKNSDAERTPQHPSTLMKLSAKSLRVRLPEPAQASLRLLDVYSFTRNEDVPLRLVMEK